MIKLIFLGTGSAAHPTRQMTSLLFIINGTSILVDCGDGMGTVRQIARAGMPLSQVNDVFLTHPHADHIIGMPHFLFVKLITEPQSTVRVFGPRRTLAAVRSISFTTHDFIKHNQQRVTFVPLRVGNPVTPYDDISVTAARMHTADGSAAPGYAYAFRFGKMKITFSADTRPGPTITRLALGSDIVIHEAGGLDKDREWVHRVGHSTARDAGELAAKVGAKHLIITHFPRPEHAQPGALAEEARKYYQGNITLAEDLMYVAL